ncbi:PspC domain-containing protein [Sphaerimonospora mesophila]|uniref:PspC domain-containing protein n=1 Tax=Sphaerimonospora mesophila TaxID=37483 RepID=UPI0006E236D8
MTEAPTTPAPDPRPDPAAGPEPEQVLSRDGSGRMLTGVCAGLGRFTGMDPVLFRVGFAVLVLASGTGILLYVAAFLLMRRPGGQPGHLEQWTHRLFDAETVLALMAAVFALGLIINVGSGGVNRGTIVIGTLLAIVLLAAHARGVDLRTLVKSMPERATGRRGMRPSGAPAPAMPATATFPRPFQEQPYGTVPPEQPYDAVPRHQPDGTARFQAPGIHVPGSPHVSEGVSGGTGSDDTRTEGTGADAPPTDATLTDAPPTGATPTGATPTGRTGADDAGVSPLREAASADAVSASVGEPTTRTPPTPGGPAPNHPAPDHPVSLGPGRAGPRHPGAGPQSTAPPGYRRLSDLAREARAGTYGYASGEPYAPHGPYAPRRPHPPVTPGPYRPVTPPPARVKVKRPKSFIGGLTICLALVIGGIMVTVQQSGTGSVSLPVIGGAVLVTIGAGLLIATWFGRGAALVTAGTIVALVLIAGSTMNGVPKKVGSFAWHPVKVTQATTDYTIGIGEGRLDLSDLALRSGTRVRFNASVSIGQLTVIVPPAARVEVHGYTRVGEVKIDHKVEDGTDVRFEQVLEPEATGRSDAPTIELHVKAGVGDVEVRRAA